MQAIIRPGTAGHIGFLTMYTLAKMKYGIRFSGNTNIRWLYGIYQVKLLEAEERCRKENNESVTVVYVRRVARSRKNDGRKYQKNEGKTEGEEEAHVTEGRRL